MVSSCQARKITSLAVEAEDQIGESPRVRNRIRELRIGAGLTLEQVAAAAGTTAQQIHRLERSERRLTDEWMHRIAPILRVKPAALLADQAPDNREFAKNAEEILVLRWWRLLDQRDKRTIAAFARERGIEILTSKAHRKP
jgi:transcriptional regulator with XRE-family HTH domain